METIYLREVEFLSSFQKTLASIGECIVPVSSIGDPSKGFILYFPIFLALNYVKGIKFLGAFIISEWINMVSWSWMDEMNAIIVLCHSECQMGVEWREALLVGERAQCQHHTASDTSHMWDGARCSLWPQSGGRCHHLLCCGHPQTPLQLNGQHLALDSLHPGPAAHVDLQTVHLSPFPTPMCPGLCDWSAGDQVVLHTVLLAPAQDQDQGHDVHHVDGELPWCLPCPGHHGPWPSLVTGTGSETLSEQRLDIHWHYSILCSGKIHWLSSGSLVVRISLHGCFQHTFTAHQDVSHDVGRYPWTNISCSPC